MICHKCRNEVREGAAFCGHCGAKQAAGTNSGTEKKNPEKPEKKKKIKGGMIALVIAAAVVAAAGIGCVLYFYVSRKNMKPEEYREVFVHLDEALKELPELAQGEAGSADIDVPEEKYEETIASLEESLEEAGEEDPRKIMEEKLEEAKSQEKPAAEQTTAEKLAAEKLQGYLEKELAPRYGYADLSKQVRTFVPETFHEKENWHWTAVLGIASAEIRDWDSDEQDEMLVIVLEEENILLSMYEVENDVPVKKAECSEERLSDVSAYDVTCVAVEGGGSDYLFFRDSFTGIYADGYAESNAKLYRYDGANLYTPLAVMKAMGGITEIKVHEYDESGRLLFKGNVYDESTDGFDYSRCYGRIAELFGEYGLVLDVGAAINGEKEIFENLEASAGHKELLALIMRGDEQNGGVVCHFNDGDFNNDMYRSPRDF